MSDSSIVDPVNDPNAAIIQPSSRKSKRGRGRLDPNSLNAPREANRSRGAPTGNQNALRHGYYAKKLGVVSAAKLDEIELRNLMGEVAMRRSLRPRAVRARGVKDYMHNLYNKNLSSDDPIVLIETLRALSLAGMAVSRLVIVHNQVRVVPGGSSSTLSALLADMDAATARAGNLTRSLRGDDDL